MWNYTNKVREIFLDPKNVGEIENPDAVGEIGNISCGDALHLTLKIEDNRIVDAKFKTFGCASAIASSSVLTEMVKGLTLKEALKITNKEIAAELGGLPEEKMHCSVMGQEALEQAINKYLGIEKTDDKEEDKEGTIVCKCFGVTDSKIKRVVMENNLKTVDDVTHYCKAGGACGSCKGEIGRLINEALHIKDEKAEELKEIKLGKKKLTNIQKLELIKEVINNEIKPHLHHDGGDLELIDIDGSKVYIKMQGSCATCPASTGTRKNFIEKTLRERVADDIEVLEA